MKLWHPIAVLIGGAILVATLGLLFPAPDAGTGEQVSLMELGGSDEPGPLYREPTTQEREAAALEKERRRQDFFASLGNRVRIPGLPEEAVDGDITTAAVIDQFEVEIPSDASWVYLNVIATPGPGMPNVIVTYRGVDTLVAGEVRLGGGGGPLSIRANGGPLELRELHAG